MKRSLLLAALFVASLELALAPSASAQFGRGMGSFKRSNDLDIQKQRKTQMSQIQKYAAPVKPKSASKPPPLVQGKPGPYGRVDLAGRPAPGYASIRDDSASAIFGPPRPPSHQAASKVQALRTQVHPSAIRPSPYRSSTRSIPPPPPIP